MLKISTELIKLISYYDFLRTGFKHRLFNLSRLAEYLHPLLEARLKKPIQVSAVTMNLSRLQRSSTQELPESSLLQKQLSSGAQLLPNLFLVAFHKSTATQEGLKNWKRWLGEQKAKCWIMEDNKQISYLLDHSFLEEMSHLAPAPSKVQTNLAGILVPLHGKAMQKTQLLSQLIQNLAMQNVPHHFLNVTPSECLLAVKQDQAHLVVNQLMG